MPRDNSLSAAAAEIQAALQDDPTFRDLTKSMRNLSKAALVKARGYDPEDATDEDEWDEEEENDEDDLDEDEDEDQDADDPDAHSGIDDERGTAKSRRVAKSRRQKAEAELKRAQARLRKAAKEEENAEDDDDEERLEEARKSRRRAEKELNRARGKLKRAKPKWAGDEADFDEDEDEREDDIQDWYADHEDSYFTNEDADHEEDGTYPPDGPAVADGDDTDQYTIGAHKVRSQRAMRRSRRGVPGKEQLMRSMAQDGRITEDLLDAAPALELIADILGDHQGYFAKSAQTLTKHDRILVALAQGMLAQGKVMQKLAKSVAVMERQVPSAPMMGLMPPFGVLAGGKESTKRGGKLQKSRAELVIDAEDAMNRGLIDAPTFQAIGRATSVEEAMALVPGAVRTELGWK